jgi:HTH-type transcriptional regulator / antitoxin HipB
MHDRAESILIARFRRAGSSNLHDRAQLASLAISMSPDHAYVHGRAFAKGLTMPGQTTAEAGDVRLERLASSVRARRKVLRLTQTELAELAGTSVRFVHTLENAKGTVRLDKVLDVLDVLGLDLDVSGPSSDTSTARAQKDA